MAEQRVKNHSILLSVDGKKTSLELFPAGEWPDQSAGDNLYRVRIDGRWHTPMGKYSFLPVAAVGELVARLLAGGEIVEPEAAPKWIKKGMEARVHFGEAVGGLAVSRHYAVIKDDPQMGPDGRWYVLCHVYGFGPRFVPAEDVDLAPRFAALVAQKTDKNGAGNCAVKSA